MTSKKNIWQRFIAWIKRSDKEETAKEDDRVPTLASVTLKLEEPICGWSTLSVEGIENSFKSIQAEKDDEEGSVYSEKSCTLTPEGYTIDIRQRFKNSMPTTWSICLRDLSGKQWSASSADLAYCVDYINRKLMKNPKNLS